MVFDGDLMELKIVIQWIMNIYEWDLPSGHQPHGWLEYPPTECVFFVGKSPINGPFSNQPRLITGGYSYMDLHTTCPKDHDLMLICIDICCMYRIMS